MANGQGNKENTFNMCDVSFEGPFYSKNCFVIKQEKNLIYNQSGKKWGMWSILNSAQTSLFFSEVACGPKLSQSFVFKFSVP